MFFLNFRTDGIAKPVAFVPPSTSHKDAAADAVEAAAAVPSDSVEEAAAGAVPPEPVELTAAVQSDSVEAAAAAVPPDPVELTAAVKPDTDPVVNSDASSEPAALFEQLSIADKSDATDAAANKPVEEPVDIPSS